MGGDGGCRVSEVSASIVATSTVRVKNSTFLYSFMANILWSLVKHYYANVQCYTKANVMLYSGLTIHSSMSPHTSKYTGFTPNDIVAVLQPILRLILLVNCFTLSALCFDVNQEPQDISSV